MKSDLLRQPRVLLLLAVVLFLGFGGMHPLVVPDEGRYPDIARVMLAEGNAVLPRLDGTPFLHKPILYYWLEMAAMALFGLGTWAIRLPGALIGLLGCVLLYQAARRLCDERVARHAALILASSPLYFLASQYADMNIQVGVLVAGSLLCFIVAEVGRTTHHGRWRLASYVLAGLAVLSKGLIGLVFPVMVVGLWVLLGWRWSRLLQARVLTGLAIIVAITLPWFILAERHSPGFLHYFFVVQHFQRFAATGFNNVMPWWTYLAVLVAGFLPWLGVLGQGTMRLWQERRGPDAALLAWLLIWVVAITVFFSLPESKVIGYILPVVPGLALWIARGLPAEAATPTRSWLAPALFLVLALALLLAPTKAHQLDAQHALAGFAVTAALLLVLLRRHVDRVTGLALALALLNIGLTSQVGAFLPHTQQTLARQFPADAASTPLMFYERYYYDLPVYLDRQGPVMVVTDWNDPAIDHQDNWRSELREGRRLMPASARWLLTPAAAVPVLAGREPLLVVAEGGDCALLAQRHPLRRLAQVKDTCLLTRSRP